MTKYIIVNGGVISGVGKGIITASVGKILQQYGFTVTAVKIDPYINVDAGTLRPTEHGETWVTFDGGEIDQDIGNYERFLGIKIPKKNSITTGQIYQTVINKERNGEYEGKTVQYIPHITDEIKSRIINAKYYTNNDNNIMTYDIVLVEIGGIVGDYENIPFLAGTKSLETELGKENILYTLVTYMPIPSHLGEMKTKPTQTAIRDLMACGIIPDIILCRGKELLDDVRKKKIETYVNINSNYVISVPDVNFTYQVPIVLEDQLLGIKILQKINLTPKMRPDWSNWNKLLTNLNNSKLSTGVNIGIICKYLSHGNFQVTDSYLSISETLKHVSANLNLNINIMWIDSANINDTNVNDIINSARLNGIIVPGGFGSHGVDGKILAIKQAREYDIPYLGLCYGMQLAVVEYARNVKGLINAHTTEVNPDTPHPVVTILESKKDIKQIGGTLRLGEYKANIKPNSLLEKIYLSNTVVERHRHRYEVNPAYINLLEDENLIFSGTYETINNENNSTVTVRLVEFLELKNNKFFVATQSHPELNSSLANPNLLFLNFIKSTI